ncbi:histidine phosphatase family protein [Solihabitans fulvus]|uniref:histidine phosphatase family protein n=1 Tax=Solihabitans fulvus TaxID=1892852 RepID=UPI001661D474|nr:histidine phosphatase family protein [Solihabitans fulvus]
MSITYLLRHGRTALSAAHITNGDPTRRIALDDVGLRQCHLVALTAGWLDTIATSVTSRFLRTQQTADLVLGERLVQRVVEPDLDEIDYGCFEGGPWTDYGTWLREQGSTSVPPCGGESWDGAVDRLLAGLTNCLTHPGPRLVVAHGLLVSVVRALHGPDEPVDGSALPEAPYVDPVILTDTELAELAHRRRTRRN